MKHFSKYMLICVIFILVGCSPKIDNGSSSISSPQSESVYQESISSKKEYSTIRAEEEYNSNLPLDSLKMGDNSFLDAEDMLDCEWQLICVDETGYQYLLADGTKMYASKADARRHVLKFNYQTDKDITDDLTYTLSAPDAKNKIGFITRDSPSKFIPDRVITYYVEINTTDSSKINAYLAFCWEQEETELTDAN